ncbi:hypothetical protein [Neobacillus rhizosphaerae]|uniref:hypothetical protein n=1 Tax=Neobacillus rhizosphaerae TaxID=2880965 RepID=UPI00200D4B06|nr:hypothetical protein [Neobacillus rhizosphaerae]
MYESYRHIFGGYKQIPAGYEQILVRYEQISAGYEQFSSGYEQIQSPITWLLAHVLLGTTTGRVFQIFNHPQGGITT